MEQGPVEKRIIQQCMSEGLPLPKRIRDAPLLHLGLELYFLGFMDLMTCRDINGNITWLAVDEYCDRMGLDDFQREDMHFYINRLDIEYQKFLKRNKSGK